MPSQPVLDCTDHRSRLAEHARTAVDLDPVPAVWRQGGPATAPAPAASYVDTVCIRARNASWADMIVVVAATTVRRLATVVPGRGTRYLRASEDIPVPPSQDK